MLGSGSIIVFDDTTSVVELALRTARFYHHESCGKCTPCREGTNWTVKMLDRMIRGEATPIDLETVASVQTTSSATASACSATRWRCRSARWWRSSATSSWRRSSGARAPWRASGDTAIAPGDQEPIPVRAGAVA